jgi:hypothetical protein
MEEQKNFIMATVYRLKNIKKPDTVYIGHTTKNLQKRLKQHTERYKYKGNYITSMEIFKYSDNVQHVIIEEIATVFGPKSLIKDVEAFHIKTANSVNKCIPNRTFKQYYKDEFKRISRNKKEYYKQNKEAYHEYYIKNKTKLKRQQKIYYRDNAEKLKAYYKQYYKKNRIQILKKQRETRRNIISSTTKRGRVKEELT